MDMLREAFTLYLKLFFLLTPFFVLGTFITLTDGIDGAMRRKLATRITLGAMDVTLSIFFAGSLIMKVFGITVDAFRGGSGVLLMITAINLVFGKESAQHETQPDKLMDMAVVPLATPITAGPATLGTLMVMGTTAEAFEYKMITAVAIILACCSIGLMLAVSDRINKMLGHANISILSKLTGLILSAIAVQMIVVGASNLWNVTK